MQSRRNFIGKVATGLAGGLATGRILAAEKLRVGLIGVGDRGTALAREAMASPGIELAAFADVYARRREDASRLAPAAKAFTSWQEMLADPSLDAVIIATPQHLHAEPFLAALAANKHVYCEKAMALTFAQAHEMRAAAQATKPVVQIGHQHCSSGHVADAANFLASGAVGQVTTINAHAWRNTPNGKPLWTRPLYPDMTPETLDWQAFLGSAPARDFDADRYTNWRLFTDYSGGNVHETLSQQLAFWYKTLALGIPWSVTMTGGTFRWKDGREVPDTLNVSMVHAEDLLFTWNSGAGSNHPGIGEDVLGTEGTIARGQQIRYLPQKVNRPAGAEMAGQTPTAPRAHLENFFDCIRTGKETNCPAELGYRVSVACAMAIESFRLGRTVYWDSRKEEMV